MLTLKEEHLVKGGVPYTKLVVDGSSRIEIAFSINPTVEIKKLKWTLNGGPIDVDENETKSPVYWIRETNMIQLVIQHPSTSLNQNHPLD